MPNTTPYLLQPAPSRKNIPRVEDMDMDQITFDIGRVKDAGSKVGPAGADGADGAYGAYGGKQVLKVEIDNFGFAFVTSVESSPSRSGGKMAGWLVGWQYYVVNVNS